MAIFKKHYLLFLTLIVLVSYGQILGMYVWKDDNAVFFKFTHINERAGYLGIGLLGSQPYKLTVTPYWFVYKLFGTDNLIPYYTLALGFYLITTLVVYLTFRRIFSEKVSKIASFLFSCGYIASDGFMWLTTSITQSLSIIFVMAVLYFYEKWYWLALGSYFLASYFNPARTHYFIVVVILFEFLYFLKKISFSGVSRSLLRLAPFLFIFYKYILSGDSRTSEPFFVLKEILSGKINYLYSFITSIGQIVTSVFTNSKMVSIGIIVILSLIVLTLFAKGKEKKDFIFLSVWMFANIYAFSSLEPFSAYPATIRYLAHSFIPLIGILGLISEKSRLAMILVVAWGLINLSSSAGYQYNILKDRSGPARRFYQDLKGELPSIQKGDIVYVDVADDARGAYGAAFTVSQMPEETALAWRYGLDRYDFSLETEFGKLVSKIKENNLSLDKIHTFFYSKNSLINTTEIVRKNLKEGSSPEILTSLQTSFLSQTPTILEMEIVATAPKMVNNAKPTNNSVAKNIDLRNLAFAYNKEIRQIRENSTVTVSSFWQDDIGINANDNNVETVWRPNRVEWSTDGGYLILDLKEIKAISKFVWVNAYPNNTPTQYDIEVSSNLRDWVKVAQKKNSQKLEKEDIQVVEFTSNQGRYIKMILKDSLNKDAPGIAEIWAVPSEFSKLPIVEAERFLVNPFEFVPDIASFTNSLRWLDNQGLVSVWWKNNKINKWETSPLARYPIIYDGWSHTYNFLIPAGGTIISGVKLDNPQIPGEIVIKNIKIRHPSINE